MAAAAVPSPTIRTADRVAIRFVAAAFTVVAALVLVATVVAAVSYVQLTDGPDRWGPAAAIGLLGVVVAACCYGLARVCRAVVRLCPEAVRTTRF